MRVAAVIVSFNSAGTLARCIESVRANGVDQVVVVDNASSDNSIAVARKQGVLVIRNQRNIGFAAACKQGAALSSAGVRLFINPDAYLEETALQHALVCMQRDEKVGVVGMMLVSPAGEAEKDGWGDEVTLGQLWLRKGRRNRVPSKARLVGWVSGGAMLVRESVWRQVGGFDDKFFMYWEDVDLCKRVREQGWRVLIEPRARVVHQRGGSWGDKKEITEYYDKSADRYFDKHYAKSICLTARYSRRAYRWLSPRVH